MNNKNIASSLMKIAKELQAGNSLYAFYYVRNDFVEHLTDLSEQISQLSIPEDLIMDLTHSTEQKDFDKRKKFATVLNKAKFDILKVERDIKTIMKNLESGVVSLSA